MGTDTSYQCGSGLNPGVDAKCGLSLLMVFSLSLRGLSLGTLVSPSLSNSNSFWNAQIHVSEF